MIYSEKKLLLLIISTLVVSFSSCYSKIENYNPITISKEVNFKYKSIINLRIANLASFKTKSSSSVPEAILSDVKSLSIFLTTNPTDPFATGANPFGDGVMISYDTIGNTMRFVNVPVGGPYYAVIAAFDDFAASPTKNNITEVNPALTSVDKKWYLSTNTVNVLPSNVLLFSNHPNSNLILDVNLFLRKPLPNNISTSVTVFDGTTAPLVGPIGVN